MERARKKGGKAVAKKFSNEHFFWSLLPTSCVFFDGLFMLLVFYFSTYKPFSALKGHQKKE